MTKIKTYSEENGKAPFDWFKALSVSCKNMSKPDQLQERSKDWVTCACGNQCAIIPRNSEGMPIDDKLLLLGGYFHGDGINPMIREIRQNNFKEADKYRKRAINLLKSIEKRSTVLINIEIKKSIYNLKMFGYNVKVSKIK